MVERVNNFSSAEKHLATRRRDAHRVHAASDIYDANMLSDSQYERRTGSEELGLRNPMDFRSLAELSASRPITY